MTEKNQILVQQFVLSLSVSVSQVGFRKGGVDILGRRTQLEVLLSVLLLAALLALLACLLVLGLGFSSGNDTCLHLHRPPVPRVLLHPTVPFLLHRLFLFPASPFLSYPTFPSLPLLVLLFVSSLLLSCPHPSFLTSSSPLLSCLLLVPLSFLHLLYFPASCFPFLLSHPLIPSVLLYSSFLYRFLSYLLPSSSNITYQTLLWFTLTSSFP